MNKYENKSICLNEISKALRRSRLSLFLGAGISKDFGLPEWNTLIEKLCEKSGIQYVQHSNERLAKLCKEQLGEEAYKKEVKNILYENFQQEIIFNFPLLVAIGAMCTGGTIRGKVNQIVTYNYDNILENYLMYYGIKPNIIYKFPYYQDKADVNIFHPHGYLPFEIDQDSDKIALDITTLIFSKADKTFWPELETIVKHNIILFLGLSFDDKNLDDLINLNLPNNPAGIIDDKPFGFYFILKSDLEIIDSIENEIVQQNLVKMEYLKTLKIYPIIIDNFNDVSKILAIICQKALMTGI